MTSEWYRMDGLALCAGAVLLATSGASIRPSAHCDHAGLGFDPERERQQPAADRMDTVAFALAIGLVELERLLHLSAEQEGC